MYQQQHFEQQHQQQASSSTPDTAEPDSDDTDIEAGDPPPAYFAKILQWSVEKLRSGGGGGGRGRKPTSTDLRRSLLVAGTLGKARAGILRQRAMQFLAARPQLMPPVGYHHPGLAAVAGTTQPQLAMTTTTTPEAEAQSQVPVVEEDEESPLASPTSAFGYADIDLVDVVEVEVEKTSLLSLPAEEAAAAADAQTAEDLLSVSAEAIVMSSVELSIRDLDDDETPPPTQQTRKRKQPIRKPLQPPQPPQEPQPQPQPPPKRTRQLASAASANGDSEAAAAAGLRTLQASFVDLSMSSSVVVGGGCRQQASQFSGALGLPWLMISPGPECHSFA